MSNLDIKSGNLVKRSQNKHLFSRDNYKERLFVLSPMSLQYFVCAKDRDRHKPRGRIFLALTKAVETVQSGALSDCGRKFALQIVYVEDVHNTQFTLYAAAASEAERDEWLRLIRESAVVRGARFNAKYHPGIWQKPGRFSCCCDSNRKSVGCVATTGSQPSVLQLSHSVANFASSDQQAAATVGNVVVAIHNFRPMRDNQLRLEKGCRYMVMDESNSKWWYVRDSAGEYGYIPANYTRRPDSLETFDWYYGGISRQRAENVLLELGRKEGCFLVRDSVSKRDAFTLSVLAKDLNNRSQWRVHHYHIFANELNCFYLSEKHACASIPELVEYHRHNAGGLVVRLRSPPSAGQDAPAPAGIGFDELEVAASELKLDKEPVGRGQFGEVFRGQLRGQQVAVKRLLDGAMAEDEFIEEARRMRNLSHPHLVQLFGVVTQTRPLMIVTDFMPYGSLKDFLRSRRQQYQKASRIPALLDMCNQIAVAMMYLEERSFIHRDLACRNILVKSVLRLHGYAEVKVSDFGMARLLLGQEYDASADSKFPVRWAAPEVFQCNRYSVKSDAWAFGVLMWEVFTACATPYGGRNNADVCQYVVDGGVLEKPRQCPEHEVYVYIMLECWRPAPADRPSFSEIVAKFDMLLENTAAFS